MAVVTPFRASHLDGITDLPQAQAFAAHPSETYWDDHGRVVACYGCVLASPGRGVLWIVVAPLQERHAIGLVRQMRRALAATIRTYGLWRVEMMVYPDKRKAVALIEHFDFCWEARLEGYGPQGEAMDLYAWVGKKERVDDR